MPTWVVGCVGVSAVVGRDKAPVQTVFDLGLRFVGRGGVEPPTFHFSGAFRTSFLAAVCMPGERESMRLRPGWLLANGPGCGQRRGQVAVQTRRAHHNGYWLDLGAVRHDVAMPVAA